MYGGQKWCIQGFGAGRGHLEDLGLDCSSSGWEQVALVNVVMNVRILQNVMSFLTSR
jgi:hypothetical protein